MRSGSDELPCTLHCTSPAALACCGRQHRCIVVVVVVVVVVGLSLDSSSAARLGSARLGSEPLHTAPHRTAPHRTMPLGLGREPALVAADRARSQGAVLLACIMMSVDALNPIKVICGVFNMPSSFAAYPFAIMLFYLVSSQLSELTYYGMRVFFMCIMSIFFTKIDVIGHSNIPRDGPAIFTGNHANQFVDAMQVLTSCGHRVGFLIARKSWNHPVVGFFARAMGCIPVMRPQDAALRQPERQKIRAKGRSVTGRNTSFLSQLEPKDKIRFRGFPQQLKVKTIVSDTELELLEDCEAELEELEWWSWDVLKYVDQTHVFDDVHSALSVGKCLGIFPEGGSHDRTDLLPLKVGIAIIAFGTMEKYDISVPIVPIGLSYFRGHRFRGRAVVEFGPPIRISPELFELYKRDRREAYATLLHQIEDSMRSCIVTAPDYRSLKLIYTARRLYQPSHKILTPEQKQDMNRRFAFGYKLLLEKYAESAQISTSGGEGEELKDVPDTVLPEKARCLKEKLEAYRSKLSMLGLRDYQVPTLDQPDTLKDAYTVVHLFLVFILASVPSIILNAPVGLVARILAAKERERALAGSVVKVTARDVMLSKKIIISIVMVPTLWFMYIAGLFLFTSWDLSIKVLVALCLPAFSYMGVVATEAGMVDAKDLRPLIMRMRPQTRNEMLSLPRERAALQHELRAFVSEVGPTLGDIYNKEGPLRWDKMGRVGKSSMNLSDLASAAASAMASPKASPGCRAKRIS
jgi:glycerol-3-phosphate O-acyltransferase/dihydroxyacetone phosphate acyltransferase